MTVDSRHAQLPTRSQRWFARLWKWVDAPIDAALSAAKDSAYVDLPDHLVEVGAGCGSNFARYRPGTRVTAFEPNPAMHGDLRAAAEQHGIELDLRGSGVEDMDLPDESQAAVVSSLTLCSVEDVDRALAEIRRILAPGGRFVFVEHIAAERGSLRERFQRLLRRPWAMVADNCDLMARTDEALDRARFSDTQRTIIDIGPWVDPSRRTMFGEATR